MHVAHVMHVPHVMHVEQQARYCVCTEHTTHGTGASREVQSGRVSTL